MSSNTIIRDQKNIYYDMFYVNNTNEFRDASFTDYRESPVLNCPANYKVSCVRMDLSIKDIPMMKTELLDLNISLYYQPDNITVSARLFENTIKPNRTIYNIDEILNSVGGLNDTFSDLHGELVIAYETINGAGTWTTNPYHATNPYYISYSQSSGFELSADILNLESNVYSVQSYLSIDLAQLFLGLPYNADNIYGWNNPTLLPPNWLKFYINAYPNNTNLTNNRLVFKQQFDSFANWYKFNRILLLSSNLGVRYSHFATPDSSGDDVIYPIITDFLINFNNRDNSVGSPLIYYPTAEYRIIDMLKEDPLQAINLAIRVSDQQGNVIELSLFPGDHFAVKLLFTNSTNH